MSYEIGGTWEEINEHGTMQFAGILCDENIVGETYDEDFTVAKERARRIVACVNFCAGVSIEKLENSNCGEYQQVLLKERDTYRDLCAELVQALSEICGVTDSPKAYKIALLAITKAEAILGDKNGR